MGASVYDHYSLEASVTRTALLSLGLLLTVSCTEPAQRSEVAALDATPLMDRDTTLADLSTGDTSASDAAPRDLSIPDAGPPAFARVRAPCFDGEPLESGLTPAPHTCVELFNRAREEESGCYLLNDGAGGVEPSYCWHRRVLVFLANNEVDSEPHPDDTDGDGVVDQGELRGQNFPADPLNQSTPEVKARLTRDIQAWFAAVSYDALHLEVVDIVTPVVTDDQPERWFRLQQVRPGFAHSDLFGDYCRRRGGMTSAEWLRFDYFVTIISHGTEISGSQWRIEELPIGETCEELFSLPHNYAVVKNFRTWNRLGTLFHEIGHGLNRDPSAEPSIGHSESLRADTGESTEYGDRSDVMGVSNTRGHFSLPQKLFMRFLPPSAVDDVPTDARVHRATIHPIERPDREMKGLRVSVEAGRAYYVEMRADIGDDVRIPDVLKAGALIKRANRVERANKSWIVDPTPETPTNRSDDSALLPHRTYADLMNGLYISALSRDDEGIDLVIRRGEASMAPPTITDVSIDVEGTALSAHVDAMPGDPNVDTEDLLYFWKFGARDALVWPGNYAAGRDLEFDLPSPDIEVWLLVSDQRGGETWRQVWPPETAEPPD